MLVPTSQPSHDPFRQGKVGKWKFSRKLFLPPTGSNLGQALSKTGAAANASVGCLSVGDHRYIICHNEEQGTKQTPFKSSFSLARRVSVAESAINAHGGGGLPGRLTPVLSMNCARTSRPGSVPKCHSRRRTIGFVRVVGTGPGHHRRDSRQGPYCRRAGKGCSQGWP